MNLEEELARGNFYRFVVIGGLLVGGWLWSRRWKSRPESFSIFVGAICGAFLGAKLLFLAAEGWVYFGKPGWQIQWFTGKTIVGALLGGYAGVEIVKKLIGHLEPTGDWFAVGVPLSIAMGRVGCLKYGCCLGQECSPDAWYAVADRVGISRWPAVPLELIFNLLFVAAILPVVIRKAGRGQLFHLYLIAYGIFRFFHEFQRATPKIGDVVSGYQIAALALVVLGVVRGWRRQTDRTGLIHRVNPV